MDVFLIKQIDECENVVSEKLYKNGDSRLFKISEILEDGDENRLNCIGDNLDSSTDLIHNYLLNDHTYSNVEMVAITYFSLLNLVVDRIAIIFKKINLDQDYIRSNYPTFQRIRKWANFVKHPKAFFLCHIPDWILVDDPRKAIMKKSAKIVINEKFIFDYYSGNKRNEELYELLENKIEVLVEVPRLRKLTSDFCHELIKFYYLIKENAGYRKLLKEVSTIDDYPEEEE